MTDRPCIDVWDVDTFDENLLATLRQYESLIQDYFIRDREIFEIYDLNRGSNRPLTRPNNQFAADFIWLQESLHEPMEDRQIRAFHYTRMTDFEVAKFLDCGVHLSTPESLCNRLDALVRIDTLTVKDVCKLKAASPFHSQMQARVGKFWMVSHPIPIDDGGVQRLLGYWGGEVASFHLDDEDQLRRLATIGNPRVIELAVPLSATEQAFDAAQTIVATFGRSLGCLPDAGGFDLYTKTPLPAKMVLRIHSAGEVDFG